MANQPLERQVLNPTRRSGGNEVAVRDNPERFLKGHGTVGCEWGLGPVEIEPEPAVPNDKEGELDVC